MKRILCILAAVAMLCSASGCHKPVPPTLTPSFDRMRINIESTSVTQSGDLRDDFDQIFLNDKPDKAEITDHRGETIAFALESIDPQAQTAVVSLSKPLVVNGQEVTAVTVGREKTYAYSYGENGAGDELALWIRPQEVNSHFLAEMDIEDITMCYGEGLLLTLYKSKYIVKSWFRLTFAGDPTREIGGTYTLEDNVLTLQEYGGLSVVTLRRDNRAKGWRVDADASVFHPQAQMPAFADRTLLTFGFAYAVDRDMAYHYEYRVTDFDGDTLIAEKNADEFIRLDPLSPTMLKLRFSGANNNARTHYLNTATGEYSTGYTAVLAETPTQIVYKTGEALVVQELGGEYEQHRLSYNELGSRDIACVLPEGDTLTVFYRDKQNAFQVGTWNIRTFLREESAPLVVMGNSDHQDTDPFVLAEDDTSFMTIPAIRPIGMLTDNAFLRLSGVKHAAIRMGENYVELTQQDWVVEGTKFDHMDFVDPPISSEELLAQLKADVAAGLATAETHLNGNATVYRYNGKNQLHAITVAELITGRCVYVGDVQTALADAAKGQTVAAAKT